jgi:hypothetical protein
LKLFFDPIVDIPRHGKTSTTLSNTHALIYLSKKIVGQDKAEIH